MRTTAPAMALRQTRSSEVRVNTLRDRCAGLLNRQTVRRLPSGSLPRYCRLNPAAHPMSDDGVSEPIMSPTLPPSALRK
jgi:hypothetical protein